MRPGSILSWNLNDGFCDGLVRGYQLGLLSRTDYDNLCQCERLDDMKLHLQSTDYGDFLANEPSPLHTSTIHEKCTLKMVEQFNYLRANCVKPLSKFLDYITYGYMIDNVVLLITGTLHQRDPAELKAKCHPLGIFRAMESIPIGQNVSELYNTVLVDTPLAPYIQGCLSESELDEMNIELIRNTLYKAYIEDFDRYCTQVLGGVTGEVMHELLQFESDRRSINITLNSIGTELTKDDRTKLFPIIGELYPEGTLALANAENEDQVQNAVSYHPVFKRLFQSIDEFDEDKSLEDSFFEYEVQLNMKSFDRQMGYGAFYSYFKLKEQEVRNIVWIAECIIQRQTDKIDQYIPLFR
eukprot:TRINITY_DN711_c7_g1_i1.p1 TRINITY_DN711_c7_g1~~TRINITY_DN711_c7_g1_i1.p1  ORF type:complete len:354 (-),score=62.52 TRINITY_DN711_c7_g1_i1:65-1126(-)